MPRIDPLQLLNCLQVLLTRNGGIQSKDEVQRLANLMTKFSKKLVSKCIYVLILKNTDQNLIDQFMSEGGWNLVMVWLQDAMYNNNISLIRELLELLIMTPVNVERLKTNNIPKLVKNLTKRDDQGVWELSNKLVNTWLKIVKDQTNQTSNEQTLQQSEVPVETPISTSAVSETADASPETAPSEVVVQSESENSQAISTGSFYKLSVRDGKQVIKKLDMEDNTDVVDGGETISIIVTEDTKTEEVEKEDERKKEKAKSSDKHRSSKSSSSSKSSKDKDRSKEKDRHKTSSSSSRSKSSSRDKDKRDKDKDKKRHNGSAKSSSKSSSSSSKDKKETKEKQAEKDKDTLTKVTPPSINKLGRIPKKTTEEKLKENKEEKKPKNFSIEPKKSGEERPRTVKVFNAKMRSTGLEEEVKPPPPRGAIKKTTPSVTLPTIPQKRPSPIRDLPAPPEKKSKLEVPERPGAIKLIPPKPKPAVLQESDLFMDALTASASAKKELKKRKRRASVSKDSAGSPPQSDAANQPIPTSPSVLKTITPPNFYQDTLETSEKPEVEKENGENQMESEPAVEERASTPTDVNQPASDFTSEESTRTINGLKGVLVHVKKSGPKKSIQWKPESELVHIQYFELDETERVNVTKNFLDMARMEMTSEREALQMSRKLPNEDLMDSQTSWRFPIMIELPDALVVPGCKSHEKDIQFAREKSVLQALYFNKRMMPDTPAEPDPESHQMTDPVQIPLDDPENSTETDLRSTPWPEPKGSPPPEPTAAITHIFPTLQPQFPNFQNIVPPPNAFPNVPPFQGPGGYNIPPNVIPGEWNNIAPNGPMGPPNMPPPEMMNQGPMGPPHMFQGPDNFNPMMNENFNPMHFNQQPNMFPPHNNFNVNRGRGSFNRGRGGTGPWVRMNGPGHWNRGRGGNHHNNRFCKNVKMHGYCRNRDNCPFIHVPQNNN